MKANSDNFRSSAIFDIIQMLNPYVKITVFEPFANGDEIDGVEFIKDFNQFIEMSDIILANRKDSRLNKVSDKLYSRDIFNEN